MSVTVKRFAKEDIGSYRCIAKNSLGEVDSSIRLYGKYIEMGYIYIIFIIFLHCGIGVELVATNFLV